MTTPDHDDFFNTAYDLYSIKSREFQLPSHFDVYTPEYKNQVDANCVAVIAPSLERGAKVWTKNGRWITIGIYRDEGRETAQRPAITNLSWTRSGTILTFSNARTDLLRVGDIINFTANVTLFGVAVTFVDRLANIFQVETYATGATSGSTGSWQESEETNFYETHYVFRLLPSFKLITYYEVLEYFENSVPEATPPVRELYNVTSASVVKVPTGASSSTNYSVPNRSVPTTDRLPLSRRFNQAYDENGAPLKLEYLPDGTPVPVSQVDSPNKNDRLIYNQPITREPPLNQYDITSGDDRVYIYDYYGFDVNSNARGPYYASDLITRDFDIDSFIGNIYRKEDSHGDPLFAGQLFDAFGNPVIGIQANNATIARQPILPLTLDSFNRPTKAPSSSGSRSTAITGLS